MTISAAQRRQTESRIRAAMDRLLSGQIPPGGGCNAKTLAAEAGISRAALYRTYGHLKTELEQRRDRQKDDGHQPDPAAAQITRLKDENTQLRQRIAEQAEHVRDLTAFKTLAISRLAAQHTEIQRLRQDAAGHHGSIRLLAPTTTPSPDMGDHRQ